MGWIKLAQSHHFILTCLYQSMKVYLCVGVSILPFSTILIFDLGIVPTVWYCLFFILVWYVNYHCSISGDDTRSQNRNENIKYVLVIAYYWCLTPHQQYIRYLSYRSALLLDEIDLLGENNGHAISDVTTFITKFVSNKHWQPKM